ncbi:MAG: hypothetical protein ACRD1C_02305 [Terriglobales bacterium]
MTVQVPRSPEINQVVGRLQHKLETLLMVFQPELVHLQGRLVRHTSREGVCCRLNLHLPTGQLSSESNAPTAAVAMRAASEDLVRQLHRHKQRLRETRPRFHVRTRPARVAPVPSPAVQSSDLAAYFGAHYAHLLAFVRRQIALREHLGELPSDWLEPSEVLNEVVVAALDAGPAELQLNRGRWLLLLCAAAIRNLSRTYGERHHGQLHRSLDQADGPAARSGDETEETLRLEDRVASANADPEENAAEVEAMARLAAALAPLPPVQRHDLVLYLLEGFRPQELAQFSGRSEELVRASLEQAEATLRQRSDLPPLLRRQLPLSVSASGRKPNRLARRKEAGMLPLRA